jgi:hypothetical protein
VNNIFFSPPDRQPGAGKIKLFKVVIYEFLYYAGAFVPGTPFLPSLMFAAKASSLPKSGAPVRSIVRCNVLLYFLPIVFLSIVFFVYC